MKMEGYYNKRVKKVNFKPGDLVLRKNEARNQEARGKWVRNGKAHTESRRHTKVDHTNWKPKRDR
jgi:beta-xylosidase